MVTGQQMTAIPCLSTTRNLFNLTKTTIIVNMVGHPPQMICIEFWVTRTEVQVTHLALDIIIGFLVDHGPQMIHIYFEVNRSKVKVTLTFSFSAKSCRRTYECRGYTQVKFSTLIYRRLILRVYNAPTCGALVYQKKINKIFSLKCDIYYSFTFQPQKNLFKMQVTYICLN